MKNIFFIWMTFIAFTLILNTEFAKLSASPLEIKFTQKDFHHHRHFLLESDQERFGEVVKEKYDLWTHYSFYTHKEDIDLVAEAFVRLFSLGQFFSWASQIDIYLVNGTFEGSIEGCWFTTASSKFEFLDAKRNIIGTAIMEDGQNGFELFSPIDFHLIARYTRTPSFQDSSRWLLNIHDSDAIPQTMLILFGTFVFDQERFN